MSTTVLLAVGDPVEASRCVGYVAERAGRAPGCRVVVLHVHETRNGGPGACAADDEPAGACLAEVVTRSLVAQGIAARARVVERPSGGVPSAIAEMALQVAADVVVVGAVAGWCRPELATAAEVARLLKGTATLQTVR